MTGGAKTEGPLVWTDGAFAAADAPVFAANDRGAILGDGVFETIKTVGSAPVFLNDHLRRMARAAAALRLAWNENAVRAGAAAVLARAHGVGALRLTLTRGGGGRGLAPIPLSAQRPRLVASWAPTGAPGDAPVRLMLSAIGRNPTAPSCRHKTLSYADAAAARAEAAMVDADDALMLGASGRVACTTIGNVFARAPDAWITPPLSEGVLPGIVRMRLLCAGSAGALPIRVARMGVGDLRALPLYRTNSLMGVQRCVLAGGAPAAPDNPLGALYDHAERCHLEGVARA